MPRVLLVLPTATYRAPDFLDAARELGAEVVVASEAEQAMAATMGDRAVTIDICNPIDAAARIAAVRGLDAVIGVDEQGVLVAAYAAAALGFAHNPPEAVAVTRDKARLRETLSAAGLRQPRTAVTDDAGSYVVKPATLSGSRGVIRADGSHVAETVERVRGIVADAGETGDVLVEEYVPGAEVAVEGLLRAGALEILAIFDKPDPLEGPYFEETIYVTPSRFPESAQSQIEKCARDATRALGLTQGPIHAEFRINEDGIWPIEVAARPIGGLCARALRFCANDAEQPIGLEELLVCHALKMPGSDAPREAHPSRVLMLSVPQSGILESVYGVEAARATHRITELIITARLHDYIAAWPEGSSYLGFIFARGNTAEEAEQALRDAHKKLRFRITPRLPVEHPATHQLPAGG